MSSTGTSGSTEGVSSSEHAVKEAAIIRAIKAIERNLNFFIFLLLLISE